MAGYYLGLSLLVSYYFFICLIFLCYQNIKFQLIEVRLSPLKPIRLKMKGSVAEWSAHWTHNLAVLRFESWSDHWICSWSSQVQILRHTCKQPTDCLMPVGVNPVMLYLNYLFQKKENEANKAIMGYITKKPCHL